MKTFIILAKLNDPKVIYLVEPVEINAKNWEEAYSKVRESGYLPFIDDYDPVPAQ